VEKSVVLLSSGLDSTVNFHEALEKSQVLLCITIDYGQRAAKQEIAHAKKQCKLKKVPHQVIDARWFELFTKTSLVSQKKDVPLNVKIHDLKSSHISAKAVWVPNRNGIMINIAAGFAEGFGADHVIVGFNKEEGTTFPDNTQEYLDTLNNAFEYSTMKKVKVKCYTTDLHKVDIVRRAKKLKIDFDLIWPCYFGGKEICGECESCARFIRARNEA
jgi:7-cyano-7-deazaguanine synthase